MSVRDCARGIHHFALFAVLTPSDAPSAASCRWDTVIRRMISLRIRFFACRGDYAGAVHYCSRAASLSPKSSMSYGCLGVAGQHLNQTSRAIDYFNLALKLQKVEKINEPVYYYTNEAGFKLTTKELQFNLLQAYISEGKYETCISTAAAAMGIPHPRDAFSGGALILVLAYVNWNHREGDRYVLRKVARAEVEAGRLDSSVAATLFEEVRLLCLWTVVLNRAFICHHSRSARLCLVSARPHSGD